MKSISWLKLHIWHISDIYDCLNDKTDNYDIQIIHSHTTPLISQIRVRRRRNRKTLFCEIEERTLNLKLYGYKINTPS